MKSLLWKEIRELAPGFALLLGSAVTLGVMDVAYNWHEKRFVGMSLLFCWLISLVAALLGGANVVAREGDSHLAFLGVQPVGRGEVWAAKMAVTAGGVVALIALSFGSCAGMLALRGYDVGRVLMDVVPVPLAVEVALVAGLFACGLLWSTVLRSAMGAAGAGVLMALGLALGYWFLVTHFLPEHWGPWVGFGGATFDVSRQQVAGGAPVAYLGLESDWRPHLAALLGLSAAAVVASALGFLRAPVLETRRRVVLTVGAWVGLVALAGGGALGWVALSGPRVPGAVQGAQTDPTGHWISVTDGDYGGLWVMDTAGQHLRRMSRAPVMEYGWAPTGERLMVGFGLSGGREWNWLADPTRGPLRLVGEVAADEAGCDDLPWVWSPRGTYMLEPVGKGSLAITEGQRETRRLGYDLGNVVGWSPDEKTLYVNSASIFGHRLETDVRTFYAVTVATGQERLIAKVTGESVVAGIADGGRWIIGTRWSKDEKGRDRPTGLFLLDIDNGAVTGLPGLYYNRGLGITGGRYLWCAVLAPAPAPAWSSWTHVRVDLESRQITARIGREQVGGLRPGTPRVSPAGDLLWFFADPANGNPNEYGPFTLFLAHADGSGLRSLGPAPGAGLVGWTYDDQLIFSDEKAGTILRLDPATGQRKVLYSRAPTGNPRPSDKDWPHAPTLP